MDGALAEGVAVFLRQEHGDAQRPAPGDDGDLVAGVMLRQQIADNAVACLVEGGVAPLLVRHDHALALGAHHDLVLGEFELRHGHNPLVLAGGKERRLVHQVGEVGAGKAGGAPRDDGGVHIRAHRHLAHVHCKDLLPAADVRQGHHHLPVKAAGAQQGRVQHIRAVGGGDDDDAFIAVKAVHLHQQLVQGLLALVMAAAQAGAPVAPHCVDFVNEDDAGGVLLGLVEHVAHPGGAHADEHLHEVRAGDAEEGHPRLAGDGLGEKRLAGARLAHHEDAARDLAAEFLELAGGLQEVHQFLDVLLGFIHAGDIGEGGADLVLAQQFRLALAEGEGAAPAAWPALHLAHEEHEDGNDDEDGEAGDEQLGPDALALRLVALEAHLVLEEVGDEAIVDDLRLDRLEEAAVMAFAADGQAVHLHGLHLVLGDQRQEVRVLELFRLLGDIEVLEDRQQDGGDDQPEQQVLSHVVHCKYSSVSQDRVLYHTFAEAGAVQIDLPGGGP